MEYDDPSDRPNFVKEEVPTPMVSDEIWKLILDRSEIPETLIHTLKGEVLVTETDKDGIMKGRWEARGDPLMNEKGIRFFTPLLFSIVTPDKITTVITEEELNRMMREMMTALIDVIVENGDDFGIPASNRNYVMRILEWNMFMSLSGSRKGTMLQALRQIYERREITSPAQKKGGLKLPSMLGGGR